MKNMTAWFRTVLGLAALAALVVGLVAILNPASAPVQRGQAASPTPTPPPIQSTSPIPTPTPQATATPGLEVVPVPLEVLEGEKIAFLQDGNVQLINVDSQAQAPLTVSGNISRIFGWSYDGSKVLLGVGERPVPPETDILGGTDLWVVNADGANPLQFTEGLEVLSAVWSPVDEHIAYSTRISDLYLTNTNGTEQKKLVSELIGGSFAWSPDGSQIAYPQMKQPGDWGRKNIFVINIIDDSEQQLTFTEDWGVNVNPQWSSDGEKILFQSNRTQQPGTGLWWMVNADGIGLTHLEPAKVILNRSVYVSKSPASDQVTMTSGKDIWVIDFEGNAWKVAKGTEPAWSPDGNRLAYIGKNGKIWTIKIDGTKRKKLSNAGSQPHWSN